MVFSSESSCKLQILNSLLRKLASSTTAWDKSHNSSVAPSHTERRAFARLKGVTLARTRVASTWSSTAREKSQVSNSLSLSLAALRSASAKLVATAFTPLRFAPFNTAFENCTRERSMPEKSAPCRLVSTSSASVRSQPGKRCPAKLAFINMAWVRSLSAKTAVERSLSSTIQRLSFAPLNAVPLREQGPMRALCSVAALKSALSSLQVSNRRSEEHTSELQSRENLVCRL